MKTCCRCHVGKPVEAFALNRARRDGRCEECRECRGERDRELYRRYGDSNRDLQKLFARKTLRNAVHRGLVSKPTKCSLCSATGCLHGHHEDYRLPLMVVWLCRYCHHRAHRRRQEP
jgi:hypothetical protein